MVYIFSTSKKDQHLRSPEATARVFHCFHLSLWVLESSPFNTQHRKYFFHYAQRTGLGNPFIGPNVLKYQGLIWKSWETVFYEADLVRQSLPLRKTEGFTGRMHLERCIPNRSSKATHILSLSKLCITCVALSSVLSPLMFVCLCSFLILFIITCTSSLLFFVSL